MGGKKQKLYDNDSCPNQLQSQSSPGGLGVPLGLRGKGIVSSGEVSCIVFVMHVEYLLVRVMCVLVHVHVLVGVNISVIMCILVWIHVHVCVAPPIVVGAWPMAGTLWRLFEYYYNYYLFSRDGNK